MIFAKEERLAHRLEDNKNNKIDTLKNELSERLKELSLKEPEEQQAYINNLYRGLSQAGTDKLNKVLDLYNKEAGSVLKTHDEVMDGYQQTIHETVALLNKYGTEFGKTKETDDFIKSQFAELMSNVKKPDLQDVINSIGREMERETEKQGFESDIDKAKKMVLNDIVKEYGTDNNVRLFVSNPVKAETIAEDLIKILQDGDGRAKGLSDEEQAQTKAQTITDFKFAILETEKVSNPADFQSAISILDKQLDFEGRKALDSAIKHNNKTNQNKYETHRIKLTEKEKDSSWQKFEDSSRMNRRLKEMQDSLKEWKKNLERPKDKYDTGFINFALRTLTNLENLITEAVTFIADSIAYHTPSNTADKDKKEEEKQPEHDVSESPFYGIMKEAYKTKGITQACLMTSGILTKEEAENIFVMDVSYIRAQGKETQKELFDNYVQGLTQAMGASEDKVSEEVKVQLQSFIAKYEAGQYEADIEKNIKDGYSWDKVYKFEEWNKRAEQAGKTFNTEVKSKDVKREEKEVPDKPESSGFRNYADGCYKIAMDVVRKTINKEYPNADAAVKDMHDRIESFKAESNMRDNQVARYSRLTNILADELAARNGTKETRDIMSKISEGCEKTTGVDRAMDLLKASMQESKGEIRQVFHEYLENTLGKMSTEKEKQEFITKMAEKIPLSYDKGSFGYKQQFILANEAREFGLRAEGKKGLSNNNDVRRVAGYVADLYKKQANGEKGVSAYKAYVALCERCSTTEEKDLVKNTVREKLSRETYALTAMTKDIIRYEKEYMQDVQDLNKVIKDNTRNDAGELGAFGKKAKEDMENITTINADQEKMQQRIEPIAVQMADDFNRCVDGSKEQFVNWCSGRSYEEIKTAIDVIDKSMISPSGSVDFANAIDTISKDVDGIGQKDVPNSNAIINDIDIEFGDFDMDFDER